MPRVLGRFCVRVLPVAAASLTLSIVALLVAAAGLGWTVFEWHRSGARLKVEVTSFVALGGMTMFGSPDPAWAIAFDVSNGGRTATTVHSLGFHRPDGKGVIVPSEPSMGPNPIPKRLEPGDSFTFPVDPQELLERCREQVIDFRALRPYANTGHGRFMGDWLKVGLAIMESRDDQAST